MEKFLIALDMDGTLLNSSLKITPFTKKILKYLKNQGHIIVLVSGRPKRSLLDYYNELELDTPLVCYNGAAIYKMKTNFPEYELKYNLEDVLYCYNSIGKENIINAMCETDKKVYLLKDNQTFDRWFNRNGLEVIEGDFNKTLKENTLSMIFNLEDEHIENIRAISKKLKNEAKIRIWSGGHFVEIYYPKNNKFFGIQKLIEYYNLDLNHVIAFGDAGNDEEMIKYVKYGICMNNGDEEIKKCAFDVTHFDNDNDGIGHYLVDFFKINLD